MAIINHPQENFCSNHFIFIGKNILLKRDTDFSQTITFENLPSEEIFKTCVENCNTIDWFSETEKNYTTLLLKNESKIPENCISIPLRQLFWDAKNIEEKKHSQSSALGGLASRAYGFLKLRQKYKFCPTCGKELIDHATLIAKECTGCKNLLFPQIEPAIIVLVSKGDKILLAKNKTNGNDFYACIAGYIEHGETAEETVYREVFEEVGLKVKNIKYRGSQPWPFPDQLMLAYTAEYESGEIKCQEEEIETADWFSRDNLPKLPAPGSVAYNLIFGNF